MPLNERVLLETNIDDMNPQIFGHLSELPIFIDDTSGISVLDMKARCRRLTKKSELSMIIVDYLQLMRGGSKASSESREREISEISRSLKRSSWSSPSAIMLPWPQS